MIPDIGGAAAEAGEPRRFLIATAVSRYLKSPELNRPGLAEARQSVIDLFTDKLGYQHHSALGMDPTRAQLSDQLRMFCISPERREDDFVAVYICSHGEVLDDRRDHVLLASDTDPEDLSYTALRTADLADAMLRGTKVRRLLLVLDTCFSGQGGNEMAASALDRISAQWGQDTGSGLVVISSAQPHQQAQTGLFPRLFRDAVGSLATAGYSPQSLSLSTVVQQMNDHPDRPGYQRITLSLNGLTGEPPAFLANPRHSNRLTDVDLAVQQAAEFDEHAQRRDTEFTRRLLVRAMGYPDDASQGWWFCGRHCALADLSSWLDRTDTDGRNTCRVVTAGPGSGKTAVLGLIAALTHPERRQSVPIDTLGLSKHLMPDPHAVDVAMYAQNLTDNDVLHGIAAAAKVSAHTVGELLEALPAPDDHQRPLTVLLDALDEAATPNTLCSRILRPLIDHSNGKIRLLLGTRPYLLDRLGLTQNSEEVVNLDAPQYADPEALQAYAVRTLLEARFDSPYRDDPTTLKPVAEAIVDAAGTSFLVARITAGTLAAAEDIVRNSHDPAWRAGLPRHAGDAMRDDLTRRLGTEAQRASDLLRPLAFAQGQGLPWEDIWAPLASALSGRIYTDEDLLWLRRNAGSYVVEATGYSRSAYRLYHQALAEHLRDGTDPHTVHAAFTKTLTSRVPYRADATRDWSRAHPYTLSNLAFHATEADCLDSILNDAEYLVHAVPRRLTPYLRHARSTIARLTAAVYRTSIDLHETAELPARRQLLALDAARAGAKVLRQQLTERIPGEDWAVRWASGSKFSAALLDTLTGHDGWVGGVACTTVDNRPVAVTSSRDSTVRLWDLTTGTPIGDPLTGHTGAVWAVTCTTVGNRPVAVTGSSDFTVRLWDLTTRTPIGDPLTGHTGAVHAVACTTVGNRPVAVTGSDDQTVRLWDLTTRTPIGDPLTGHTLWVLAAACTTVDNQPIAVTGSYDNSVRLWNLASRMPLGSFNLE
ncbi:MULTISPECIES: caspase family protein, partial [Streptomyces]|uniref:caspase family protein n=1 Tax=Streptomyces TaxID=1883 RepID=UPI000262D378